MLHAADHRAVVVLGASSDAPAGSRPMRAPPRPERSSAGAYRFALPDRSRIKKSNDPAIPGQVGCRRRHRHDGQEEGPSLSPSFPTSTVYRVGITRVGEVLL